MIDKETEAQIDLRNFKNSSINNCLNNGDFVQLPRQWALSCFFFLGGGGAAAETLVSCAHEYQVPAV